LGVVPPLKAFPLDKYSHALRAPTQAPPEGQVPTKPWRPTVKTILLDHIDPTPAELARLRPCPDTLARYTEMLQEGVELPPVTVFQDAQCYWLADGRHRLEARRRLGYRDIQAEVKPGSRRDAQLHFFSANLIHGLASNRADRKQVARLLLKDEDWKLFPNRRIGEICGLSHTTVGALRNSLESLSKISTRSHTVSSNQLDSEQDSPALQVNGGYDSYDPAEDDLKAALDTITTLSAENDQLRESIALGNLDLPEEEKIDLAAHLKDLRVKLEIAEMENKTLATSRDIHMTRLAEVLEKVKKLQYVLKRKDEEINSLKQDLSQERKRVESLETELAFEQATR